MVSVIRIDKLFKSFGEIRAVDGISFQVEQGEIFGFLGPNGAGKTTTMRLLTGVIRPDGGSVVVDGVDVAHKRLEAQARMGIVPETSNVYQELSARNNLIFMGELHGMHRRERDARADELLETFGLAERANSTVKGFSKGMKRRLVLAMALIHDPSLILLDEPVSGLDVQSQRLIRERIRELNDEGRTIFITTHDMEEANRLCHRVAIIDHGTIAAIDTPEGLKSAFNRTQAVEFSFRENVPIQAIQALEGAMRVESKGDKYRVITSDPISVVEEVIQLARERGTQALAVNTLGPSLEDVFVELTGGA